jgi:hypothetical protein
VISPEQQDDEGEFLLVQFEVIAWEDEKQRRRRAAAWAGLISGSLKLFSGNGWLRAAGHKHTTHNTKLSQPFQGHRNTDESFPCIYSMSFTSSGNISFQNF